MNSSHVELATGACAFRCDRGHPSDYGELRAGATIVDEFHLDGDVVIRFRGAAV